MAANRLRASVNMVLTVLTKVRKIGIDRCVLADREAGSVDQQRLPLPPYCVASVGATGLLGPRQFQTDSRLVTFTELDPCRLQSSTQLVNGPCIGRYRPRGSLDPLDGF
jgi:hypothetical protein